MKSHTASKGPGVEKTSSYVLLLYAEGCDYLRLLLPQDLQGVWGDVGIPLTSHNYIGKKV